MKNIFKLQNEHICITSDEEIKRGDWCFRNGIVEQCNSKMHSFALWGANAKKIILTTDTHLIKDGVQSIDDEFLVWLVKNPSCERVEINKEWNEERIIDGKDIGDYSFKIIIPQEKPKQKTLMDLYLKNNPEKAVVIEQRVSDFMNQLKPKQ
jgi:hypothetical protein